jgi:hypothetical protein
MFSFDAWVDEQARKIETAVRDAGQRGMANEICAWVVPSARVERGQPGYLHVGTDCPLFGCDIVRLGPHGSRLGHVPYSHIWPLLWRVARSYPILPIPAEG